MTSHKRVKCWSKKNIKKPMEVFQSSHELYLFNCDKCKHEYKMSPYKFCHETQCYFCCNQQVCTKKCNYCFVKTVASHEKSKCWSKKNKLTARQVFRGSDKKYIFDCDVCKHEIITSPMAINAGSWCKFCSNYALCDNIKCNQCYLKSFASHEKAKYWSSKNELQPYQLFKGSNDTKYKFDCNVCNHEFESVLLHINNGYWCPFCSNSRLCGDKECNFCFEKSFATHKKAKYWSDKNELKPYEVLGVHKKNIFLIVIFVCMNLKVK